MKISAKGLLFDYGGTIDTNGTHWGEVIRHAFMRSGVSVTRDAFREAYTQVERMLGNGALIRPDHAFRDVLRIKLSLQFDVLGIKDRSLAEETADACYADTLRTIHVASGVLSRLTARYPAVLVSNFYGNLRTVLDEFHLSHYFKYVIESAEAGIRKPDPAIYRLGIDALGLRPGETVIIGDSYKNDIRPAGALGCPSIWLKGKGWDEGDEAISHPCIIRDFTELQDLLL